MTYVFHFLSLSIITSFSNATYFAIPDKMMALSFTVSFLLKLLYKLFVSRPFLW